MKQRALLIMLAWSMLLGCRRTSSSETPDAGTPREAVRDVVDAGLPVPAPAPSAKRPQTREEILAANAAAEKARQEWINEIPAGFDWKNISFAPYVSKRCGSGPAGYDPKDDRCGFGLDIPTFLRKSREQGEGGSRDFGAAGVALFVSASPYFEPIDKDWCFKARSATIYKRYDTWCWQSGRDKDSIFWRKDKLGADGNHYIVQIEYPAAHKTDMDPVVTRISATWHQPLTDADKATLVDNYDDVANSDK